jgi:hypothetical protein
MVYFWAGVVLEPDIHDWVTEVSITFVVSEWACFCVMLLCVPLHVFTCDYPCPQAGIKGVYEAVSTSLLFHVNVVLVVWC